MGALIANGLSRRLALVRAEIVEDDDIARPKSGGERLLDIGSEDRPVDRSVDDQGSLDPVVPERGDKGECLPVAVRDLGRQPLAPRPPAAQRGHVGLDPGLVEKDQTAGSDTRLMGFPPPTLAGDVRAILFGGQRGFF